MAQQSNWFLLGSLQHVLWMVSRHGNITCNMMYHITSVHACNKGKTANMSVLGPISYM